MRAGTSRNNVKYVIPSTLSGKSDSAEETAEATQIVFPSASLGVVYDVVARRQKFYQGHDAEVSCVAVHHTGTIVATADMNSNIHVWKVPSMTCVLIIKGLLKDGVQHLAFSPAGDRLVALHFDADSTVTLYNCATGELIASSRGIPAPMNVHDIAYSPTGDEITLVGTKQVKFFDKVINTKRALESKIGRVGKIGKKQTFFCVTYLGKDVVVGCADGSLYRFSNGAVIQVVQAHAINEPVLCITFNTMDGVLVTGGKDCLIKSWDSTLTEVGASLDMSEDLDGDGKADCGSLSPSHQHLCKHLRVKFLLEQKGSDIFEASVPLNIQDSLTIERITWGHGSGKLYGLGVHPTKEQFATCGDDQTLRIWSIRSHEQINVRTLPHMARALAYDSTGDVLCVGMQDGTVSLIEANVTTLRVFSSFKHTNDSICLSSLPPLKSWQLQAGTGTYICTRAMTREPMYDRQCAKDTVAPSCTLTLVLTRNISPRLVRKIPCCFTTPAAP